MTTVPPPPPTTTPTTSDSTDQLETLLEHALTRLETERKAAADQASASAAAKEAGNRRVSIAALLLTMMLSFLGFVRANEDGEISGDKVVALQSKNDAATEWTLYQTKIAQRSFYHAAQDALAREALSIPAADPRRRLGRFHHREYEIQVHQLDEENRQVFYVIQELRRREYHATKDAEHHGRRTKRYDMAIRTLTLALVLISVTLLVTRKYLFWFGLFVASIGALLGVTGYFLR
ncbi:hypothetical protein BH11MYX2_BH11MYX2_12600 [soil metagenome]